MLKPPNLPAVNHKLLFLVLFTNSAIECGFFPQDVPGRNESNTDDKMLRKITKLLATTEDDCINFLLELGYKQGPIDQQVTNHPRSIQTAAWNLTCRWWDSEPDFAVKAEKLLQAIEEIGKGYLKPEIEEQLRKSPSYRERRQPAMGAAAQASGETLYLREGRN